MGLPTGFDLVSPAEFNLVSLTGEGDHTNGPSCFKHETEGLLSSITHLSPCFLSKGEVFHTDNPLHFSMRRGLVFE
jgi:hypothetical protein